MTLKMYAININASARLWHQLKYENLKQRTFGGLEAVLGLRVPKTVAADLFEAAKYNDNRDHLRFLLSELRKDQWCIITINDNKTKFVREMEKLLA